MPRQLKTAKKKNYEEKAESVSSLDYSRIESENRSQIFTEHALYMAETFKGFNLFGQIISRILIHLCDL